MFTKWFFEEDGQTLVEYGLILSFIALAVVAATALLGRKIRDFFFGAGERYPSAP